VPAFEGAVVRDTQSVNNVTPHAAIAPEAATKVGKRFTLDQRAVGFELDDEGGAKP
jgi:hypothetical protein